MDSENLSPVSLDSEDVLRQRRLLLAQSYSALPSFASPAFWQRLKAGETPLEVIVRCLRHAVSFENTQDRECIIEILFGRTYSSNQKWSQIVLRGLPILDGERAAVAHDLCADLYERIFKAVSDPTRLFWEENFLHCLYFERKHVYQAFLFREGYWKNTQVKKSTRIPRTLLESFDQPVTSMNEGYNVFDVVDEGAQHMLETVVDNEMLNLVLTLPERLKAVILLKFWDGRTEKETARILGISDRTVRHRVLMATELLRKYLEEEKVGG